MECEALDRSRQVPSRSGVGWRSAACTVSDEPGRRLPPGAAGGKKSRVRSRFWPAQWNQVPKAAASGRVENWTVANRHPNGYNPTHRARSSCG
jgi:hypothetical protein